MPLVMRHAHATRASSGPRMLQSVDDNTVMAQKSPQSEMAQSMQPAVAYITAWSLSLSVHELQATESCRPETCLIAASVQLLVTVQV